MRSCLRTYVTFVETADDTASLLELLGLLGLVRHLCGCDEDDVEERAVVFD